MSLAILPDRGVLEVAGPDRAAFLQGLVSNDVTHLAPGEAAWSALLTPATLVASIVATSAVV